MTTTDDDVRMVEARAVWRAEAEQKITVERMGNSGNAVVFIEGHEVARFLCFGAVQSDRERHPNSTYVDTFEEARRLCSDLRLAYECLAGGMDFTMLRAARAVHDATYNVCRAAENAACRKVLEHFPTATEIVVFGEYNEESLMSVRLQMILDGDGHVLYDTSDPTEAFEDTADEIDHEYLLWLEHENDDWAGQHSIPIETT